MKFIGKLLRISLGLSLGLALISAAGNAGAQTKPLIKLGYVEGWDDSVATTNVAALVIEKKLGYRVELVPVAAGIMWQGVARGDLDATLSAWLPATHAAYYANFKDKVLDLGPNFNDAKIGLIVPDYVSAKSIGDLEAQKTAFKGRIVGIDAGAGVMTKTQEAIKAYGLDLSLQPSSGAAMTVELGRAIRAHEAVAVTGWIPHWMFAKWQLRFLDDPKQIYGVAEHVDTVVNPGLQTKAKPVYDFLKNFQWKPGEINTVMLATENGAKPAAAAQQWLTDHPERVGTWLPAN